MEQPTLRKDLGSIQNPSTTPQAAALLPLLIGKYVIEGDQVVWSGRWGMGEASFSGGLTSLFEMKSKRSTTVPINPDLLHPAGGSRVLKHTEDEAQVANHPVFTGYDSAITITPPTHGIFDGYFQIQAVKGKITTVPEKGVEIRFSQDIQDETKYGVYGIGSNKYGVFHLKGHYSTETGEMRVYKLYQPKVIKTKPATKRAGGRSTRKRAPVAKTPKKVATPKPVQVKTPVASVECPLARGRSERKRVIPAHLRDSEFEAKINSIPLNIRKCLDILRHVTSNPIAQPFLQPVDPIALNIPHYTKVITNPMDLGTVKANLESGVYKDPLEFAGHVRLTFSNAMLFNRAEHSVHMWARKLSEIFEKKYKHFDKHRAQQHSDAAATTETTATELDDKRMRRGKKAGSKKRSKQSEIEMMKAQIEEMKSQIRMMHASGGTTPTGIQRGPAELTSFDLNRAMTFEEKRQLSKDINKLPEAKLGRVIQIINERVPLKPGKTPDDEIEIDINSFDTPTLRTLQAYVRSALTTKRKRTSKPKGMASQLQMARHVEKATAERIQSVQMQLQKLQQQNAAAATGNTPSSSTTPMSMTSTINATKPSTGADAAASDSSSSDSSSDSSSASESDSSDDELNISLQKSPVLGISSSSVASSLQLPSLAKDKASTEPVKVENKGAWSLLASTSTVGEETVAEEATSSLWTAARSQVQQKQQREEEIAAEQHRLVEARERENATKREELERQKVEKEEEERHQRETAVREAEEERIRRRDAARKEREEEEQSVNMEAQSLSVSSMEAEFGKTSSFLS